ncbi:amidohydrolase [Chromobacterium phragmitis]|uniref:Amidohydrolase n=1 Tax=Chromobacterium phragmitis TaxID=2202141 RepID=A0A344UDR8_9NEIS|nr:amidohydrolase [Chromobacterium phragmitis]AXE33416.1 amidohydrolase [Chromobacterium phragmitis]
MSDHHQHEHHLGCACCALPLLGQLDQTQFSPDGLQQELDALASEIGQRFPRPAKMENAIFHGGIIRPLAAAGAEQVEALGIAGGGIVAAGDLISVRAAMASHQPCREIHLEGRALLPGLIDPHMHILPSAIFKSWLPLGAFGLTRPGQDSEDAQVLNPDYSFDQIKSKLAPAIQAAQSQASAAQPAWVLGFGVDPSLMRQWTNIDAGVLDQLAPAADNVAVFLLNASGHIGYANTAAMKAAELSEQEMAHCQGVLTEASIAKIIGKIPPKLLAKDLLLNLLQVLHDASARGNTTLFDAGLGSSLKELEVLLLKTIADNGLSPVRIAGALYSNELPQMMQWMRRYQPEPDTRTPSNFSVKALKLVADGSNQGLTGFQFRPYLHAAKHAVPDVPPVGLFNFRIPGKPAPDGESRMPDSLASYLNLALGRGWPVLVHSNGDHSMEVVLDSYQQALEATGADAQALRLRVEHASLLTDAAMGRMAKLGLSPSFLIGHVGYWGHAFQGEILGEARAELLDRCKSASDAGMRFTLHSDHFVSPLGSLRMAEQAIYRKMEGAPGESKPVLNAEECLSHRQAMAAVTLDAAWQCHMEQMTGSLEAGKQADLVILDQDPLDPAIADLRHIVVHETWRGGARVYANQRTH